MQSSIGIMQFALLITQYICIYKTDNMKTDTNTTMNTNISCSRLPDHALLYNDHLITEITKPGHEYIKADTNGRVIMTDDLLQYLLAIAG